MKVFYGCTLFMVCLVLCTHGTQSGATSVINTSAFDGKQRPDAVFDHDLHMEITGEDQCALCHHVYKNGIRIDGESSEGMFCSDCHSKKIQKGTTHLTRAFHQRCKGCHRDQKTGPVLCAQCHINTRANDPEQ